MNSPEFSTLILVLSAIMAIPIVFLTVEILAAAFLPSSADSSEVLQEDTSVTVLIPAHNEASGIAAVLQGIQGQLRLQDHLVVVADNCTDATADIARTAGATVIERCDSQRRGKGYALDVGIKTLSNNPPDVLVMMDADCHVATGSLLQLAAHALATHRPVQARYLFQPSDLQAPKALISAFAIKVKNWIRPLGLLHLGLPSLLFGTGMAFPWSVLPSVNLAHGHLVEDMKLGFDLAIAGHAPLFFPAVTVVGKLPHTEAAITSQRTRWEHGHLQVLGDYLPILLGQSIRQRRLDLLTLALDLAIPPLSLLALLWLVVFVGAVISGAVGGSWLPGIVVGISGCLLAISMGMAWSRFAKGELPGHAMAAISEYILWQIPLYSKFAIKPQSTWIRTARDDKQDPQK